METRVSGSEHFVPSFGGRWLTPRYFTPCGSADEERASESGDCALLASDKGRSAR